MLKLFSPSWNIGVADFYFYFFLRGILSCFWRNRRVYMCVLRTGLKQNRDLPIKHCTNISGQKLHKVPLFWRNANKNSTTGVRQRLSVLSTMASHFNIDTRSTFAVFTRQWSTFLGQRLSVSCSVVSVSSGSCREAMWEQFLIQSQDIWRAG